MSLTLLIIGIFIIGYVFIATESATKVNKTAIALLMCVVLWALYAFGWNTNPLQEHLGETCETIFFLLGAMTIVEIVDINGGFNFVSDKLKCNSEKALMWRILFMTFFLSAILDNMTTSIVMIMVLRKLVPNHKERMLYAGLVIIAANAGGAFSPIGDVTTIMLWIKGNITTIGVIKELIIPSIVSMVIPGLIVSTQLKGDIILPAKSKEDPFKDDLFTQRQRKVVFFMGVGGLIFVPIFREITGLPPYMGILFVLSLLWVTTDVFYRKHANADESLQKRVSKVLHRIDLSTILFFLGILMAVAVLAEAPLTTDAQGHQLSALASMGNWLDNTFGNAYIITGIIGCLSSVIDNVPLVASCMGMYDIAPAGTTGEMAQFVADGTFWQMLAFCAGVGGSMLIIGSAAGVVVMGLEKISFGWYMKHFSWLAFAGYIAGMGVYWVEKLFI